jgi:uncharacterized phage-associated protein
MSRITVMLGIMAARAWRLAAWTLVGGRASALDMPDRVPKAERPVVTVFDVADYIISKIGPVTTMKLQKLVFYCQAWHLVWEEAKLFGNRVEAWAGGPVVPDLYQAHRGEFTITAEPSGDRNKLDRDERESIDAVLKTYGDKTALWLSTLSHSEEPWIDARKGLGEGERGNREIKESAMAEFYGNL